jgi:AcrR family transcriptional regulator
MSPRSPVTAERTRQILDAAMAVFARLGFRQARMDDIAEDAGVSKGTLYLYFKSKDDLIAAILRRISARELDAVRMLESSAGTASDRLLQITRELAAEVERLSMLLPIWFEFYAIAGRQRGVRQFFAGYFADFRAALTTLIQQGIDCGEFRAVDASDTAITLCAIYEGLTLLWSIDPQSVPISAASETAVRLLLEGLQVRD